MNIYSYIGTQPVPERIPDPVFFSYQKIKNRRRIPSIEGIVEFICDYYQISSNMVRSSTRKKPYIDVRKKIIFFLHEYRIANLINIARFFRKKQHSTVINACTSVKNLIDTEEKERKEIEILDKKLKENFLLAYGDWNQLKERFSKKMKQFYDNKIRYSRIKVQNNLISKFLRLLEEKGINWVIWKRRQDHIYVMLYNPFLTNFDSCDKNDDK